MQKFILGLRRQIGVADDAGADHLDLCIVFPASYMALAAGWPTIDLDYTTVALVPKLWARDRVDEAVAECSTAPLDLRERGPGGLWGFTSPVGSSIPTNVTAQTRAILKLLKEAAAMGPIAPPTLMGEHLAREELERAFKLMGEQPMLPRSSRLIVSPRRLERGRYAATQSEAAATYAEDELLKLPRRRWLRRRHLRRQIAERSNHAAGMRQLFGYPR
jgi:hypothetical protein